MNSGFFNSTASPPGDECSNYLRSATEKTSSLSLCRLYHCSRPLIDYLQREGITAIPEGSDGPMLSCVEKNYVSIIVMPPPTDINLGDIYTKLRIILHLYIH